MQAYLAGQPGALLGTALSSRRAGDRAASRGFEGDTDEALGMGSPRGGGGRNSARGLEEGSAGAYGRGPGVGFGERTAEPGLSPEPQLRRGGSDPVLFEQQGGTAGGHQVKHVTVRAGGVEHCEQT